MFEARSNSWNCQLSDATVKFELKKKKKALGILSFPGFLSQVGNRVKRTWKKGPQLGFGEFHFQILGLCFLRGVSADSVGYCTRRVGHCPSRLSSAEY